MTKKIINYFAKKSLFISDYFLSLNFYFQNFLIYNMFQKRCIYYVHIAKIIF